jgi:cytochrome c556
MRKIANLVGIVGILACSVPVLAAASDTIRSRIASYRELGAAFKGANDALRGEPQIVLLQQSARQISNASKQQYGWFPAGSGTGAKTAAKPEIWSNSAGFRTAQDNFARQAEVFRKAVASGNAAVMRVEVKKLGAACKGCHDQFRNKDD